MNTLCRSKPLLGTFVDIELSADLPEEELLHLGTLASNEIERIQKLMSFHDSESELSHINREAYSTPVSLSPDTQKVIEYALNLSAVTDGLYDICIADKLMQHGGLPAIYSNGVSANWRDIAISNNHICFGKDLKLDLGGIAKGYAVDCAINVLMAQSIKFDQVVINAGGDMRLLNWKDQKVDIRHPSPQKTGQFFEVTMQAAAIATSAPAYTQKHSLIVKPDTGKLLSSKDSITVFADNCMTADALTKVMFLTANPTPILEQCGASAIRITPKGAMRQVS